MNIKWHIAPPLENVSFHNKSLPGNSSNLPRIPTHAHARRVHHRQEHLPPTLMLIGTALAEPTPIFINALRTHLHGRLPTHVTGDNWRLVSGYDMDGGAPFQDRCTLRDHLQA